MSKTLQILVVDDNIDAATTVVWLLESMGYENCTVAHDGPTALDVARELQPDVILLDLGLPGMNGYEVCRELRRNPMFADTLIIAQTGWGEERNREMAYFAGFNHHFVKPLKPDDLAGLLAKVPARKAPAKQKSKDADE
jgi:CheY-like chemotaxis protein